MITTIVNGQTSWKGTVSTAWNNASNWTAGIPTSATDAVIGDASFTGSYQPAITYHAACRSLTIGGSTAATLTISKNITVGGAFVINSNGTVSHGKSTVTVSGNFTNNGSYTTSNNNATIILSGASQTIGGSVATTFRKLTINTGSVVTLASNITVSGAGSQLTVSGTLNPGESPSYLASVSTLAVNANGVLKVNASTFAGNYTVSGSTTLSAGSTVEYSATAVNQTISSALTYATLKISGSGTKSLGGNLTALNSSAASEGNIYVTSGTFDLGSYTANRGTSVAGGTISVSNNAYMKIGGANTFPANFATNTLSLTSTVEYAGTSQTISAKTYGNLTLSSASGSVTKTFPASALTIAGNFTSTTGSGTGVTFTAAGNITVSGNVNIGAGTSFDGGSYTHSIAGNWVNNGTFAGNTSTVIFTAGGVMISGSGSTSFNNITFNASNITAASGIDFAVTGNMSTTGPGSFTHSGGTITFSGTGKTISGTDINFDNLTVSGSLSTASGFTINGNLQVSNSFTTSAGTITMSGTSKSISGSGAISLKALSVTGSLTTASSFTITGSLDVSGSFSASAGTATFNGTATLNGTANLYNVTLNGTSLQLSTNSVLGIANTYTLTAGTLDVTTTTPNTVNFNGTTAQNINGGIYHHLLLSGSGVKTAAAGITTNGNLNIVTGSTFSGGSYSHTLYGNWINNGSFTPGTGAIVLTGTAATSITGATTFNTLTLNKASSSTTVQLQNNISTPVLNMNSGLLLTGANTVTITSNRTGNGIILGNIQRTHSFTTGTAYAFEGPDNTITFSSVSGVTGITVNVTPGDIGDFPHQSSLNRLYTISIPSGTYTAALRLHYEDAELNGNDESSMALWHYSSAWGASGKTASSTASNYIEQNNLNDITGRFTLSDDANVVRWNGSVSSDWNTAANWTVLQGTPGTPPSAAAIVEIGTGAFTYQPVISTSVSVKNIVFGGTQACTLTLAGGGALTTSGNINGNWTSNVTHTIEAGSQSLNINGDLQLGDGTAGHAIDLHIGSGSVTIGGSLSQTSGSNIVFTGAGTLNIGTDFTYSSGTLTPGNGTVVYNGSATQNIAAVNYYHLQVNKSNGIAAIAGVTSISGNLTVTAGELDINANTTVTGHISIASGAILNGGNSTTSVGGNWVNNGSFVSLNATIQFNGTGAQTATAGTFNNFVVNKTAGTLSLTGNISVNGNLSVLAGTFDMGTYTANRSSAGGTFAISDGASLLLSGASNFPANYSVNNLGTASTVQYNGTVAQAITGITYGNLVLTNGGTNTKTLAGSIKVNGDMTIGSTAAADAGSYTISLYGNWVNNGSFTPSSGTLLLNGSNNTITGNTPLNRVTVYGSYSVINSDITFNGFMNITSTGSFSCGNGTMTVNGDLTNSGTLTSTGTTTFTGTVLQTIRLAGAMVTNSYGVINFNGNVSPVLNSTSTPTYMNLNINNTAGVSPSVNWTVYGAFTIGSGATFNGGVSTHTFAGSFTNNGTCTSSGALNFTPSLAVTVNLGSNFSSTGMVTFGGSGLVTLAGTPAALKDVTIANTNSAGITPPVDWSIGRNFTVNSNAIFNGNSHTYTVGGNIESNGRLHGESSTFILSSSTAQVSGSDSTVFNHLTISGSTIINSDINVAGNFTNNGTFDASIGSLVMTGGSASTIGGTTSPATIAQMVVSKSNQATVTLARNISAVTAMDIFSGILDAGSNTISQDATGGALGIEANGTLRIGGTNTLPTFNSYAFDTLSTVEYAGSTQSITAGTPYGNLTISASGTKTPSAALTILNNFSLANGTFAGGSYTHTVGGNWNMTSGAFTNTGTTILLNGTGNQDMYATGAFNNLTINKTAGSVTQSGNITVNGTLTFTSGKINIGNNNLTMGATGSIAGAGATTGYVIASGTGTLTQPVNNGASKTFPVGTTANYVPATIALSASGTSDNFNVRLLNGVYNGGTSGSAVTSGVVNNTWLIGEATPGGSDATVTLQWPQQLETTGFSRQSCRLAHYTSSAWDYGNTDLSASGTNPYTVSRASFTSFSPFVVSSFVALPVTWVSVGGNRENNSNHVYWTVTNEYKNAYFMVETSIDGSRFTEKARVAARNNNGVTTQYNYTDEQPTAATMYYRIKQVDVDGHYSYSKIVPLTAAASPAVTITCQNPVQQNATVVITVNAATRLTITLLDATGHLLYKNMPQLQAGKNEVNLDVSVYAAGIYYCRVTGLQNGNQVIRIVKNR